MPDNWFVYTPHLYVNESVTLFLRVFLTGKSHVEYRRVLNTLFTRKALRYAFSTMTILYGFLTVSKYLYLHPGFHHP